MPQSLANVVLHITFSTKNHAPFLRRESLREALNAYVVGTLDNLGCPSIQVNCVEDHIHILCNLSRTLSIAKLLEEIKKSSSKWIKEQDNAPHDFFWQAGYGAFSVSQSNVGKVKEYIINQQEHHRKMTFQDEFRELLRRHGIEFDERYVWD
jgi:REP element-mobilizing transposase RayT